ncbi:TPA: type IV pilus biogenesis/stability protein PilW, partial [Escherichia coli]
IKIEQEYREDRVSEAFRSEFSKVAKVAVDNHDYAKALEYYKFAIEDDPFNSALHDRFSWFLSNKMNDLPEALKYALKAIELNNENCDALVNVALIHYRQNNIPEGDKYIDKAESLGRAKSFCLLRKAIARYHLISKDISKDEKNLILNEVERL